MAYLALGCRTLIVLVFAISALAKLRSGPAFRSFASWVATLPLPLARSRPAFCAGVMAGTEAAIAVLVAVPASARAGLLLAAVVLAGFAAGVHVVLRRGTSAPCRCFGTAAVPLGRRHVGRNLLLCAAAATGAAVAAPGSQPAGIAVGLGAGAAIALVVVFLDDITAVLGHPRDEEVSPWFT